MHLCPLCNSTESTRLFVKANYIKEELDSYAFASRKMPEYMHHEIIECTACRLLLSVNVPDAATLHSLYKEAAYDSADEAKYASNTYIKYLAKHTKMQKPLGRAMDIGTGEGSFLKLLLGAGYESVVGIEPSKAPIDCADEYIRPFIVNDVFTAESYDDESFDLITLFQTLEHIPEPKKLVSDVYRLLKRGGCLFVVCHDYRSVVNRLLGTKSPIYDIEHLHLFSASSLRKLLVDSGFTNVATFAIKNVYPFHYWMKLFPMSKRLKKHLLRLLTISKLGSIKIAVNVGNVGIITRKG